MLLGDFADQLHLIKGQHSSCRVARADAADGLGLRCDRCFDQVLLGPCVSVLSLCCERYQLAVYLVAECVVVRIERFRDERFLTRVEQCCEDKCESFTAAVCDKDVIPCIVHVIKFHVVDHRIEQFRHAAGFRISNDLLVEVVDCFLEARRCLHIRLADVQTIHRLAVGFRLKSVLVESSDR